MPNDHNHLDSGSRRLQLIRCIVLLGALFASNKDFMYFKINIPCSRSVSPLS